MLFAASKVDIHVLGERRIKVFQVEIDFRAFPFVPEFRLRTDYKEYNRHSPEAAACPAREHSYLNLTR
jgi:hypothetical protein